MKPLNDRIIISLGKTHFNEIYRGWEETLPVRPKDRTDAVYLRHNLSLESLRENIPKEHAKQHAKVKEGIEAMKRTVKLMEELQRIQNKEPNENRVVEALDGDRAKELREKIAMPPEAERMLDFHTEMARHLWLLYDELLPIVLEVSSAWLKEGINFYKREVAKMDIELAKLKGQSGDFSQQVRVRCTFCKYSRVVNRYTDKNFMKCIVCQGVVNIVHDPNLESVKKPQTKKKKKFTSTQNLLKDFREEYEG